MHALCSVTKVDYGQFFSKTKSAHRTYYVSWYIHTHPFNGPFPGLPRWAGTRKVKPIWILLKQETVSGTGISWAICKSAPRSRQIIKPATHHSVFYRPDALPAAQPTVSKHWRLLLTTIREKSNWSKVKSSISHLSVCVLVCISHDFIFCSQLMGSCRCFVALLSSSAWIATACDCWSEIKSTKIAVCSLTCHNAMKTHMPHGITQCNLPPDRADIPTLTPAEAGTRLSDPGGMQGWVDLVIIKISWPKGIIFYY